MRQEQVDPSAITARVDNPNRMEAHRFDQLCRAIKRAGFLQPVLVRDMEDGSMECVDGHHRLRAAQVVGLAEVPAIVLDVDDVAHGLADALQLGMNTLRGEIDLGKASSILAELREGGWDDDDLEVAGFTLDEIDDLIAATSIDDEDVMTATSLPSDDDEEKVPKPFRIELEFASKPDYSRARKVLKRAAGQGNELSVGLLNLIDAQD